MDPDNPFVFINPFTVPADRRDDFRKRYALVMGRLSATPGFRGSVLHAAAAPDTAEFAFVDVNRWASKAEFQQAIADTDPEAVFGALADKVQGHGSLYRIEADYPAKDSAVDLVARYFAAVHKNEVDLLALIAEDAVIAIPASLPYGGEHRGHAGFRQAVAGFAAAWRDVETHDLELIGGDTRVVAVSRMTARAATTGAPFETRVAEKFLIRNGLIVEVRPFYFDTAAMLAALKTSGDHHDTAP